MLWLAKYRMSLKRLRGITGDEITQLGVANIQDQPGLQKAFDESEDAPIRSISAATQNQNGSVSSVRVVELLSNSLDRTSKPLVKGHFGVHWADYLVGIVVVLLIIGLLPSVRKNTRREWDELQVAVPKFIWGEPTPERKTPTVVAARGIPAFKTLSLDDMKIENGPSASAARKIAGLGGRYALVPIPAGTTISDDAVSKEKFDFTTMIVVRVALKNPQPISGQSFPISIVALFSAREGAHVGAQIPATLLALDSTPRAPTAILALDSKNAAEVAKWIGSSDAYILVHP
jgi:hypothetical protein